MAYISATHGTAMSDCRETARGGAKGLWLDRQSYSSPMECLGVPTEKLGRADVKNRASRGVESRVPSGEHPGLDGTVATSGPCFLPHPPPTRGVSSS